MAPTLPDLPRPDFEAARNWMVDGQVRPNKVTNPRLIAAMRTLKREAVVPPSQWAVAYADLDVQLGGGRVLMEPMVIARLVQSATVRAGDTALVVCAGVGYGAALLAACGAEVTAFEDDPALRALSSGLGGTKVVWTDAMPAGAFDVVLVEGAVPAVPAELAESVRPQGGRLLTVLRPAGAQGVGIIAERVGGALRSRPLFDCATAPLPRFAKAPAFTL